VGGNQAEAAKPGRQMFNVDQSESRDFQSMMKETLKSGRKGQDLIEFAIVLPLLLLVLFGVVDLGRLFHSAITITNAARVGARYGALRSDIYNCIPSDTTCVPVCDPNCGPDYFISITEREGFNNSIDLSSALIVPTCIDGSSGTAGVCDYGDTFRVIVTYDFDLLFGEIISMPPFQIVRSIDMLVQ
jgi:hypothetical protein